MVYLAGDNDLDRNGREDSKEMKSVGTTADINVVAQFDSESAGHRTTRYLLTKGSDLAGDVVGTLGATDLLWAQIVQSNGQASGWKPFKIEVAADEAATTLDATFRSAGGV